MTQTKPEKYSKPIKGSEDAYSLLKPITDAAQSGELRPWSPPIIDLLASYGISVRRKKGIKAQVNLTFPTSPQNRSMAIGVRYAKGDDEYAEDLFVFEEEVGLTCYYRGAQEDVLPEYSGTHHAKIVLSEALPDVQRDIADIKQQIATLANLAEPIPEITLMVNARANNNRFDVTATSESGKQLVMEKISVGGIETQLNQQFRRMYPIQHVNIPEGVFDIEQGDIEVAAHYRTLDGRKFKLTITGQQEFRNGDQRYNIIFPNPAGLERL